MLGALGCPDHNALGALVDQALPPQEARALEAHIDECDGCRRLFSAMVSGARPAFGSVDDPPLGPGATLDHFSIIKLIGRGGMGEVFLARDTLLGRKVALKLVRDDREEAPLEDEALREARALARLSHPHIVTVYAVGLHRGQAYIALEYIEGASLALRLRERKPGLLEAVRWARAIVSALAAAHAEGVLHLDLKPGNVLIGRDGRLQVVDFGLAQLLTGAAGRAQVRLQSVRGTPTHMAPEQWDAGEASAATDIWAFGVILYELICGERPYSGATVEALRDAALAPLPSASRAACPPALAQLIDRCLSRDPQARPQAPQILERLDEVLGESSARPRAESPFRGLLPFDEEHQGLFFGRDRDIWALVEQLEESALVPIVGPSGVGKSSLVRAGLVPRLREQGRWLVIKMRPGGRPFEALAVRLIEGAPTGLQMGSSSGSLEPAKLAEGLQQAPHLLGLYLQEIAERAQARILLLVDQLEELLTLCEDPQLPARFMAAIAGAADSPALPIRAVLTIRDDLFYRVAELQPASAPMGPPYLLKNLTRAGLREALLAPIEAMGYRYEPPQLVDRVLDDVRGAPAQLPLLQFATALLWERRDESARCLRERDYLAIGGVHGALARHADDVLSALPRAQQELARRLLLRLITPEGFRRVVERAALLRGLEEAAPVVLEHLISGRLISALRQAGEVTLELAHESLITAWALLARWRQESHKDRLFLAEVEQAAELWESRGDDHLWRGDALEAALRSLAQCAEPVPDRSQRFLRRSAQRARVRRFAWTTAVVAAFVLALAAASFFRSQEAIARKARAQAEREGARAALASGAMLKARAKLRSALQTEDALLSRFLWRRLSESPKLWGRDQGSDVHDVAFSPDGATIAASTIGAVHLLDRSTGQLLRVLRGFEDRVYAVAISPDGQRAAAANRRGHVWLWPLQGAAPGQKLPLKGSSLAFSPDGKTLAVGSTDKRVKRYDLTEQRALPPLAGHEGPVYAVAYSPAGLLASAGLDATVRLWSPDGAPAGELRGAKKWIRTLAFSPDGKLLAAGGADCAVLLWDVKRRALLTRLEGHSRLIADLAFSPDGARLVSGSSDNTVRVWDLSRRALDWTLNEHTPLDPGRGLCAGWPQLRQRGPRSQGRAVAGGPGAQGPDARSARRHRQRPGF